MELNRELKNRFLSLIKNGKVSHSYIIAGGEGAGKVELAKYFSKALLCEGEPCGRCAHCKKVELDTHPDVIFINRGGSTSFKIDEVRRVIESVYSPPNEGSKRIYILDHCENMTPQAQNALLKVFEEPPEYVVFFILTEVKEALLPTVLSRASMFTVPPTEEKELCQYLEKKYPKETPKSVYDAVRLSEGFYGKAVKMLEKGAKEERAAGIELASCFLGDKSGYKASKLLFGYKNKRDVAVRVLFYLLYAVRDTALYKSGGEDLCFLSAAEADKFSSNSFQCLSELSDIILETVQSLESGGNYTSATGKLCCITL